MRSDEQGQAMLSPLRFHSDSQELALPGRLGFRHEWEGPIECENPRRGI